MTNAHLRFGWLRYYKRTEKTTTTFKLRLDRFIGEVIPDPPRRAKAHFMSVVGGDTQISAVNAAISLADNLEIEGPGVPPIHVCLERNAQCYRGSVQLSDRKKPLRHLVGISEEFGAASAAAGRVLLAGANPEFLWTALAKIYGLPGVPEWAHWFNGQLKLHNLIVPLLGIGCNPVLIKGDKQEFLQLLSHGVKSGHLRVPPVRPVEWPRTGLADLFITRTEPHSDSTSGSGAIS
jgi:hypothetical protein